uniref:Uncharacterized protein n=1 Tax=Avena sativa TaxID=4498 RepID=A0ACD5UBV5_AVESA
MVFWCSLELLIFIPTLLVVLGLYMSSSKNTSTLLPLKWPLVGILPSLVPCLYRLHHSTFKRLETSGHSHKYGIANIRIFMTCDPANIQHILSLNHANYPKGDEFAEIFDVTRGSLFTADGEPCRRMRASYQGVLRNQQLVGLMTKCCLDKVENGLLPLMAYMAETSAPVDMSDLMTRLVFDLYATAIFGVDPARLSLHMPQMAVSNAMDTVMEVGLVRQIVPATCWKVMRRLNIGPEKRLAAAQAVLRCFTTDMIKERRRRRRNNGHDVISQDHVDVLSNYINDPDYNDDLLQATLISYMIAGRDTISTTLPWIFYRLAKDPRVVSSIRDELAPIMSRKATTTIGAEDTKHLMYLEAVLLETLRLYPPIPVERKSVAAHDVMPSGHTVSPGDTVLVSIYSVGRIEAVWGSDCREYRPDRWLSEDGRQLRHVPSHKFPAFNSGPRLCLGKDIAITHLKIIVAAVVWNFDVIVLDGQAINKKLSCLLQMNKGLKVNLKKREMQV